MSQESDDSYTVFMVVLALAFFASAGGYFFLHKSRASVTAVTTTSSIRTDLFWKGGTIDLGADGSLPEHTARDLGISDEQHEKFKAIMMSYMAKLQKMKEEHSNYTLEGTETLLVETEPFPEKAHVAAMKLREELVNLLGAQEVEQLDQNMPCAVRFAYWGAYRYTIRFRPDKEKDLCYIEHSQHDPHGGSSGSGTGEEPISGSLENQLYHRVLKELIRTKQEIQNN